MSQEIDVQRILREAFGEELVGVVFQNLPGWQKKKSYPTATVILRSVVQFDARRLDKILRETGFTSCRVVGGIMEMDEKLLISSDQFSLRDGGGLKGVNGGRLGDEFGIFANWLILL